MDIKKIIAGVGGVVALGVVGLVAAISMQPGHIHLEREVVVQATASDMAPFAGDLKRVNAWSPWEGKDPDLKREFSEKTTGVGAWYSWDGNDDVGAGKQTIIAEEPGKVVHSLEFYRPFEGQAEATISWSEQDNGLAVVWAFDQDADFPTKAMTLFMSFEDMLGPDYEKGLTKLQPIVETAAKVAVSEKIAAEAKAAKEAKALDSATDGSAFEVIEKTP